MTYIPNLNGFADYNDAVTTVTPIILTANTWTDIPNDGLGSFTNLNSLQQQVILTLLSYI